MCCFYVKSDCIFLTAKHSHYFLISYGHCSNCATCAISGKVAGTRGNRWKLLKDDLKCYISLTNNDPK